MNWNLALPVNGRRSLKIWRQQGSLVMNLLKSYKINKFVIVKGLTVKAVGPFYFNRPQPQRRLYSQQVSLIYLFTDNSLVKSRKVKYNNNKSVTGTGGFFLLY